MMKRARRAWLATLWWAAFGVGCSGGGSSSQVLTGRIDATGVVAIRAVSGTDVVTAAQVGTDGSFRIALPSGERYRLEVLTAGGVKQVIEHESSGWKQLEFKVCTPKDPFDIGTVGDSGTMGDCDPMTDPNCKPCGTDPGDPPPCMDPLPDGSCPPTTCTDPTDPNCKCTDPMDPNCQPPPSCGGANEPPCPEPEPCMDPNDPWCQCKADGTCGDCDPGDPNCTMPPPDCEDPMDPNTCKDPCVIDPMSCGCTSNDPNCWPPPEPPTCKDDGMCDPGGTMTPENAPDDFGCVEAFGK